MNLRNPSPPPTMETYYATFPFGTRHMIGVDMLNMSSRWVEVRAMSRDEALSTVSERFGDTGWQLHSEDQFTQDRRKFYPQGCRLVLWSVKTTTNNKSNAMKNQDLTTIYLNLDTEDCFFYELQTGGESVSGFFEYVIERRPDEDILGAVPFCIDIDDVLNAASACRYITDYENTRRGLTVYEAGSFGEDIAIPVEDWVENMVADHNAAMQAILREAVRRIFTAQVEALAVEIASGAASCSVAQRIRRDVDTSFCDAIEALAEIIRTVNEKEAA